MRSALILAIFAIYAVFTSACREKKASEPQREPDPSAQQEPSSPNSKDKANAGTETGDLLVQQAKTELVNMADVNGDGRADLVFFTDLGVFAGLSNGKGFHKPELWTRDFAWGDQEQFPRFLGDVNGDKKADIVGFSRSHTVVSFSQGDRFGPMTVGSHSFGLESADGSWFSQDLYPRMLGYVNDDPYIDIVACRASGCYVALSNGVNFQMPTREPWIADFATEKDGETSLEGWISFDLYPRFLGDVDGDGRSDIIGFGKRGVWVSLAAEGKFENKGLHHPRNYFFGTDQDWSQQSETPRLIGDIDGDGKVDILGFDWEATVYLSYGKTQLNEHIRLEDKELEDFIRDHDIAGKSLKDIPRFLADIDGDGKAELVFVLNPNDIASPDVYIKKIQK